MKIQSQAISRHIDHPLHPNAHTLLFRVLYADKIIMAGVGCYVENISQITQMASLTMGALAELTQTNTNKLCLVQVSKKSFKQGKVKAALQMLNSDQPIMFLCETPEIYDKVVKQSNPAFKQIMDRSN